MALWLVRAGAHGEFEKKFLEENRIYLTWDGLSHDLAALKNRGQLRALLEQVYPDAPKGRITNNLGQIWAFSQGIANGDWVVLPRAPGSLSENGVRVTLAPYRRLG